MRVPATTIMRFVMREVKYLPDLSRYKEGSTDDVRRHRADRTTRLVRRDEPRRTAHEMRRHANSLAAIYSGKTDSSKIERDPRDRVAVIDPRDIVGPAEAFNRSSLDI